MLTCCLVLSAGIPAGRVLLHSDGGVWHQVDHAAVCPHTQTGWWVDFSTPLLDKSNCLIKTHVLSFDYLPVAIFGIFPFYSSDRLTLINCSNGLCMLNSVWFLNDSVSPPNIHLTGSDTSCIFWLQVCHMITMTAERNQWVGWSLSCFCLLDHLSACWCVVRLQGDTPLVTNAKLPGSFLFLKGTTATTQNFMIRGIFAFWGVFTKHALMPLMPPWTVSSF